MKQTELHTNKRAARSLTLSTRIAPPLMEKCGAHFCSDRFLKAGLIALLALLLCGAAIGAAAADTAVDTNQPDVTEDTNYVTIKDSETQTHYSTIAEAAAVQQTSGTTYVIHGTVKYDMPSTGSGSYTFEGADGTSPTIDMTGTGTYAQAGMSLTFKNLKIYKSANAGYEGLAHSQKETYQNCTFECEWRTYGTTAEFTGCTFLPFHVGDSYESVYNVFIYGSSKVTFDNCKFTSTGKAIKLFSESPETRGDITIKNCTFTIDSSHAISGKQHPAVQISCYHTSDGGAFDVVIENCTASGFTISDDEDKASYLPNTLWGDQRDDGAKKDGSGTPYLDLIVKSPVTVSGAIQHGSITVDKSVGTSHVSEGKISETGTDIITVTANPEAGWQLGSVTVTSGNSEVQIPVTIDGNTATFTMYPWPVIVSAEFTPIPKYDTPSFEPTVSGAEISVNITDYDKDLKYEYRLNDTKSYISVHENPFTISGLQASTDYTIHLRVKGSADGKYLPSDEASRTVKTADEFSVRYNANGGLGKEPQTQESTTKVTVASPTDLYRLGYTFSGWNTQADGSGTSYQPGDSLFDGAVLYAQWTGNKYTVTFDANGGAGEMDSQEFTYGEAQELSENKFIRDGMTFAGWAVKEKGSAIYGDKQEVQDITTESEITLYAVWAEHTYTINVTVTGADPAHTVKLTLKRGAAVIAEKPALSASFEGVPAGIYTIVADEIDSDETTIVKTVTKRVDVEKSTDVPITFPAANVNSVVEVSKATVPVIADGIDQEAAAKAVSGKKVTVTLNVEPAIEEKLPDTASEDEQEVQEAIALVKDHTEEGKSLEFISFTIKMDVGGKEDKLKETSNVIQLLIPFDFGAIKEGEKIEVSYVHNGEYVPMEETEDASSREAGTYYLDREHSMIYINTNQFSVYAVSYKASSYSVTIQNTDGGTASADPAKNVAEKTKVTLTPTPDAGYKLSGWNVLSPAGLKITNNTFKMPASDVVIAPVWEKESSKRGSSGSQGSSYWATETPTATPTPTPTATPTPGIPTVKPTTQIPTGKSPAPLMGLLAGLGAAAVVFGLRRK